MMFCFNIVGIDILHICCPWWRTTGTDGAGKYNTIIC